VIELKAIEKVYDLGAVRIPALEGTSLSIAKGEFVSIMGPSGSGKSTLLHLVGLLDRPTAGTYRLDGHDVTTLKDRELARVRNESFGFVFQSFNLLPEFNALENVMMPLTYSGLPRKARRRRAQELLERMGLSERLYHYPAMLSGGEQQRVAIARALVNKPVLLLADEPTGNLPSEKGREILALLRELNDDGVTVVFVTHDERLASWGRRLVRLQDGRVVGDASIADRAAPGAGPGAAPGTGGRA
jgi:putative ABC transport system ATP-binding protein